VRVAEAEKAIAPGSAAVGSDQAQTLASGFRRLRRGTRQEDRYQTRHRAVQRQTGRSEAALCPAAVMAERRGDALDRPALQRILAEAEERLAHVERQIENQRKLVAKFEADGREAGNARRLLAGLELLLSDRRSHRDLLLKQAKGTA
jgi:hypothetical protein